MQHVFLKLLSVSAPPERAQPAYLYRAVRNTALNHLRDRRHDTELPETEFCFTHPTADRAELLSLQNALRQLSDDQRETVFLKIWAGMTLQEIATATETPLNTAASRYRYALEKLREQFLNKSPKAGVNDVDR